MQVIVQHQVKDPARFFADIPSVALNAPPGVHPRMFCPSADRHRAVCLYVADSLESVREYVDAVTAGASDNAYFVIDETVAIGLPTAA